jgi:hypothetical protein
MQAAQILNANEKMTDEEAKQIAFEHRLELVDTIRGKILPELKRLITLLHSVSPCKEFQLSLMDIESTEYHLTELWEKGPSEVLADIPLEDSEVKDNLDLPIDLPIIDERVGTDVSN